MTRSLAWIVSHFHKSIKLGKLGATTEQFLRLRSEYGATTEGHWSVYGSAPEQLRKSSVEVPYKVYVKGYTYMSIIGDFNCGVSRLLLLLKSAERLSFALSKSNRLGPLISVGIFTSF